MIAGVAFFSAFISSLILVRIVRSVSTRRGLVAKPREDRWHKVPTPSLGGVGIFLAFIISLASTFLWDSELDWPRLGLLVGSLIVFCLGLYDDIKKITLEIGE